MREQVDCFVPQAMQQLAKSTLKAFSEDRLVRHVIVENENSEVSGRLASSEAIRQIGEQTDTEYVLLCTEPTPLSLGQNAIRRLVTVARNMGASMVYCDRYSVSGGHRTQHPSIDYQQGSVRDDFDFGSLILVRSSELHEYISRCSSADPAKEYQYAALYDLRLFLSRKEGAIFHLNEYLYTEEELDTRRSGEKQFDYVDPKNRTVQLEMEQAVTNYLKKIGAFINPSENMQPDFDKPEFENEASVIIPVYNRDKTIAEAVKSALNQETSFKFNVIVVNNHSTDRTGEILDKLARSEDQAGGAASGRLVQIVPERTDLGIGGCWNEAVNSDACGRFAIQLDSDDLYSSPHTLQRIVEAFRQQGVAMVIGSYRMCDFDLNTLPPGLIDHREWTDQNGCNNALRVNGLGSPRAFFTPIIREVGFPNTSYGEDYAVGLVFSRCYRIGRIYDELYLCRRWGGNSDANLSVEKTNANNLYKDRLRTIEIMARKQLNSGRDCSSEDDPLIQFFNRQLGAWPAAEKRYRDLSNVQTKVLDTDIRLQFNPARMVSTGAKIDRSTLAKRPCFLCPENRPEEQMVLPQPSGFELLVNPFPILPVHFTIPKKEHCPQRIQGNYGKMHQFVEQYGNMMIFYNGPECGASAPDHAHLQAGTSGLLPLQANWQKLSRTVEIVEKLNDKEEMGVCRDFVIPFFVIRSRSEKSDECLFSHLYKALSDLRPCGPGTSHPEPMMNIVSWKDGKDFISVIILRRKHRPDCYFATGVSQILVSPGALDMSGLIITPRKEDFEKLTSGKASAILRECGESSENINKVVAQLRKIKEEEV